MSNNNTHARCGIWCCVSTLKARACAAILAAGCAISTSAAQSVQAGSDDENFCTHLKEIVQHTKNDFAGITNNQIDDHSFATSIILPDQELCYIMRSKSINYMCESQHFDSKEKASGFAAATLQRASACLGKLWEKQSALSEFFTALNDEEHQRSFIVSVGQNSPFDEYFVQIQIARMYQQELEPPAQSAAQAQPAGYCTDLKRMIDSGISFFDELIGKAPPEKTGRRSHWRSEIQLPNWQDCFVHQENDKPACRYVSCSVGPLIDQKEAAAIMKGIAAETKACLGKGWAIGKARQSDGTINLRLIGETAQAYVEVRPSKSLYTGAWNVKLDVSLDLESCD